MALTKPTINTLLPKDKDYVVWDDRLPGFGVRVKPSGVKSFVLQYRNRSGASKRLTLGRVGQLTLDQARKEATRLKGGISLGSDPAKTLSAARNGDTLRDLAKRYMDDHCAGRCKETTIKAHTWLLDKYILPRLGARKITDIGSDDIARFHKGLAKTKYNANRCLGLIRAMYGKAEESGLIEFGKNPASSIRPFREEKKQRYLTKEEFQRLLKAIDELAQNEVIGVYQAAAVRLLAFTGCRLSEILELEWRFVDLENKRITFAKHKTDNKGIKTVPLNKAAIQVLESLERQDDNPFVICGRKPNTHLVNLQKPWRRLRKAADLDDVRLHDLRHSFASAAASSGIPLMLVGGLLGHSSPQSTARYAHLWQEPLARASEDIIETFNLDSVGESNNAR